MRSASMRAAVVSIAATAAFLGLVVDVAAAPQVQPQAQSIASGAAEEAAVWALLQPPVDSGAPNVTAIAEQIARAGPSAVGPVVAILLGESVEPDVAYTIHPQAIELRRKILMDALRRLPAPAAIDGLRSRITAKTSVDVRVLVIQILAEIGGYRAFDGVMGIAEALDPIQFQRTFVQVPIEESLVKLAARNPRLVRRLEQELSNAPVEFAPLIARALTTARVPTALHALPACLGRDPALDLCALQELAKIGGRWDPGADPDAVKRIRDLLESPDGDVVRAAAVTLASIGDADSCAAIIAKLGSSDPLTVAAARWSLETMSGAHLGADHATWLAWYTDQNIWLDDMLPKLAEDIVGGDPKKVTAGIDELLMHRIHRHEVATTMRAALLSEDVAAQRLGCDVLARLGSPRAVPWLVEKLDSANEDVRQAAWRGLREITKVDLPLDAVAWRIALAP